MKPKMTPRKGTALTVNDAVASDHAKRKWGRITEEWEELYS
jgi:hypothetical protein